MVTKEDFFVEYNQTCPPRYIFFQFYKFISVPEKFPSILFSPILLLLFKEISHLYFYSELSSIRNSMYSLGFRKQSQIGIIGKVSY